ncbi:MAG: DUF4124 domain-containing protein [Thalassotalea sp.]
MNKALLLIISSLTFTNSLHAQVYKIVDANGKVTYSQIEPSVQKGEEIQVESLDISVGNNGMSTVRNENGESYCGEISLPSKSRYKSSSNYFSRNVKSTKESWKRSLARLSEDVKSSSQYNVKSNNNSRTSTSYKSKRNSEHRKSIDRDNQRMRDLRCAINWADGKKGTINALDSAQKTEKIRLNNIKTKLESSIVQKCGAEPIYDPSLKHNKAQRNKWKQCSRSKQRDLRKVNREINRLR